MLYVTTRNHRDSYTAQRALTEQRGPDGGLYIPFRVEPFSQSEIESMAALTFNQRLAMMLNYLFKPDSLRRIWILLWDDTRFDWFR